VVINLRNFNGPDSEVKEKEIELDEVKEVKEGLKKKGQLIWPCREDRQGGDKKVEKGLQDTTRLAAAYKSSPSPQISISSHPL